MDESLLQSQEVGQKMLVSQNATSPSLRNANDKSPHTMLNTIERNDNKTFGAVELAD